VPLTVATVYYEELCAVCHADGGSGIDDAPSLHSLHHRDKQLLTWILDGKDEEALTIVPPICLGSSRAKRSRRRRRSRPYGAGRGAR
jgi:hypothetical protein